MTWIKKTGLSLLALLLALSCLTSCGIFFTARERTLTPYEEIVYQRPDFEALEQKIEDLTALLADKDGKKSKMAALLYEIADTYYYEAYSMANLAFVHYAQDITDTARLEEYYLVVGEIDRIGLLLDELYRLCAVSPHKTYLENKIMGEGFFDAYEGGPVSYPPELLELFTEENRLLMSYSGAMADLYVEYEGEHYTEADIADLEGDERYPEVVRAYEEKYNRVLGEIYMELVAVRQQIAEIFGYADYADYAYETLHQREFTPQQAKAHLNRVKETLAPVCQSVFATDSTYKLYAMSTDRIMDATDEILKAMSKDLSDIYVEMRNKRLYTVGASDRMYNGSFQTYFNRYDTPYLFVNGTGGTIDILSVLHEFGHFSSAYYNYGVTGSLDQSEVASQALELLSLRHLRTTLSEVEVVPLEEYIIERFLALYVEQAAQAAFEDLVYADEDLTLEECNDYYAQCLADFGLASRNEGREDCWVFINHFFEMPYYIISYSVAADVAVQLYELGEGQSVETYLDLIARAHRCDFLGNLAEVGLTDPLDESRPEAMAAFFSREIKR